MTEVENDQDNYETNVWDVFRSLGQGCRVYLIQPVNGATLWVIPPDFRQTDASKICLRGALRYQKRSLFQLLRQSFASNRGKQLIQVTGGGGGLKLVDTDCLV